MKWFISIVNAVFALTIMFVAIYHDDAPTVLVAVQGCIGWSLLSIQVLPPEERHW